MSSAGSAGHGDYQALGDGRGAQQVVATCSESAPSRASLAASTAPTSFTSSASSRFQPVVSYLNILPSRQNVLWRSESVPLSVTSPREMALALSGAWDGAPRSQDPAHAPGVADGGGAALPQEELLSMPQAVSNLANTVLGVGVLSVPYAFRLSGYSTILLVLLVIVVTARTADFIGASLVLVAQAGRAKGVPPKARDFAFLAHAAFGQRGRLLIGAVTSLEVWFALVTFMVMNGVNASLVWPGLRREAAIAASSALAAVTVLLPMRVFSYLSLVSSMSLVVASLAMVGAAFSMPSWANPYNHLGQPALVQLRNVPRSVGIIVFCFAGHPCFPIVHECMRDPRRWRASVGFTFLLALLFYGGLGVFGYLVFGGSLEASFTQNIAELPNVAAFRALAAGAFLVKIQLTAPLLLNAIMVSISAPSVDGPEWSARRVAVLAALSALTCLTAAAFADAVAAVASLTGSLFTMATSVLFPTAVHLRLARRAAKGQACWCTFLSHWLILPFGAAMALVGTAFAAHDLAGGA